MHGCCSWLRERRGTCAARSMASPEEPRDPLEATAPLEDADGGPLDPLEDAGGNSASRWQAVVDKNGETYYWNASTGETTWDVPAEVLYGYGWDDIKIRIQGCI